MINNAKVIVALTYYRFFFFFKFWLLIVAGKAMQLYSIIKKLKKNKPQLPTFYFKYVQLFTFRKRLKMSTNKITNKDLQCWY